MSVRRLAEPAVQPATFAFDGAMAAEARKWVAKYPKGREQSAIIPLLMLAQEQEGWVTRAAIEEIAGMLGMPLIRALEVATFYTQFQLKPVGTRAHVQVCGTTPCMLRGSEALMQVCREKIHPEQFHPNAEGTLSWEEVECLGACVNAPMVMIFKDTYEDLTPVRLAEIIDAFEAGRAESVRPGPQVERIFAAPAAGLTSLKDEAAVLKAVRERAAKPAEEPAPAAGQAVPPTLAARPKTDAPETSPALKSPSKVKAPASGEKAASVEAPPTDRTAADRAEPEVEGSAKRRSHPHEQPETKSLEAPEFADKPVGPAGKRTRAAAAPKPALDDADRPVALERPERPDDLQLISGIGPKIEATLHSLGVYTFAQIAGWKEAERRWVDGYLNFRGRIEREDWVRQADALARGGEAEYVRVFGKEPR